MNSTAADITHSVTRASRARFAVLALISLATLINYLDRTVISVAAPLLAKDLGLGDALLGVAFSAFSWTYTAAQIPGGLLLDRIGTRLTYFLSLAIWSLVTAAQGLVSGIASLTGARLALGIAEAPAFPCNSRVLATWFPQSERARANSVFAVGQYVGLAFLSPLLFWVTAALGWRALFIAVGAIGTAFAFIWYTMYREPRASHRVNQAELDYIAAGGGLVAHGAATRFDWRSVRFLLRQRQVLGASIGQFASNATLVFFLTWFPTYLTTARHMSWLHAGFMTTLPFVAATFGVMCGGYLSDHILKKHGSVNVARKLPVVAGLLLASSIVAANFLQSNALVITVMSIAFFGQGMCNLGWTLITDVAPEGLVGLTGGIFNLCANLAGIVTPVVVGLVVEETRSFAWALTFIAVLAIIGVLSYVFLLGDVQRVEYSDARL